VTEDSTHMESIVSESFLQNITRNGTRCPTTGPIWDRVHSTPVSGMRSYRSASRSPFGTDGGHRVVPDPFTTSDAKSAPQAGTGLLRRGFKVPAETR